MDRFLKGVSVSVHGREKQSCLNKRVELPYRIPTVLCVTSVFHDICHSLAAPVLLRNPTKLSAAVPTALLFFRVPVCPHYCFEADGPGTFTLQLWCCLGLFCKCIQACCLLWKAKVAGRVYEAEKLLCYVGYVGPVTEHSFLNHCISHIL